MRNNKKKGFTLIELIAVIAILAILGAILIPNVLGYRKKAEKSNIQTSAKTIKDAIATYNSDKDTTIGGTTANADYLTAIDSLSDEDLIKKADIPTCLKGTAASPVMCYDSLTKIADGSFVVTSVAGTDSSISMR